MTWRPSHRVLGSALFALSLLFSLWFHEDRHAIAALAVFTLPPLLLLAGLIFQNAKRTKATAAFWSGVLGLFWFSHGIMVAWSRPPERAFAWLEIALAIAIILASSWPGLGARFGKRRRS